jgi:hypothetical protein
MFSNMVEFGLKQVKLNSNNITLITNTIWGVTQLIKTQHSQDQWQQSIMSAKLLLQVYDPEKENQDSKFSEDKLRYWKDSHKAIERLKKDIDKAAVANTTENTIYSVEELDGLQSQADNILKISSLAMVKLANASIDLLQDTPSSYDIKSLSIGHLVDEIDNTYIASEALVWRTPLIYNAPWAYTLVGEQVEAYSEVLNKNVIKLRVTKLPFYKAGQLLTVEYLKEDKSSQIEYYLESIEKNKHYKLNGTSLAIHKANVTFPIQLNTIDEVAAYLRFFTTFVQAEEGSFLLVESNSEINWLRGAAVEEKKRVANLLRPVYVWPEKNTGNWFATATVSYSNRIFHAKFKILETGMVEMLDDMPVASDLAISSFKIEEKSGRPNHFINEFTLGLIDGISLKNMSDEIKQLNVILDDSSNKSVAHKESIFSEIMSLTLINKDIDIYDYQRIQSFLTKQADNTHIDNRKQAGYILDSIIDQAENNIDQLQEETPLPESELSGEFVSLSFYQLFASGFQGALESAEMGIELDESRMPLYTNYAHALLFLDRIDEAMEVYRQYRGTKIQGRNWEEIILDDFDQLESVGITHPQIVKIRKEFSKNKPTDD